MKQNLFLVTVSFKLNGQEYIRRRIAETGINSQSASNKVTKYYANKNLGDTEIISVIPYYSAY